MGIDVLLYAEVTPTEQELEAARALFRRSGIADDYESDGKVHWRCLEFEDETAWHGPRVVANVGPRYWGPGYERGDWPSIYGAIRLLQAAFPTARVFYGGDTDDIAPEFTEETSREFWDHFVGPDGNGYRDRAARWSDNSSSPGATSHPGPHPGCDTPHPHTHPQSQPGPTPDDAYPPAQRVHNHPPYQPVCNERTVDGQLRGACLNDDGSDR